jgi:serine/threonine-protein kinase RsbW
MREFVRQAAEDADMGDGDIYAVQLAVDEACSNIIEHACHGRCDEQIEITCTTSGDHLTIMIRDHGEPFDPTSAPDPDLDAGIKNRPVGGLGIFLMRQLTDEIHYEQMGESGNILTLVKYRKRKK